MKNSGVEKAVSGRKRNKSTPFSKIFYSFRKEKEGENEFFIYFLLANQERLQNLPDGGT